MSRLRSELEYIRLVRPTAFARAIALDARDAALRRRDPLTPPHRLGFVGSGDFRASGDEFREQFVELAGLRPDEDVLDVGSGVGRVAVGLTGWLQGRYEGIDIVRRGVEWCQQAITPRYPNFSFQVADLYNRHYNPEGRVPASEYRFPFEDQSFDFVVLTSVFTHLLPPDRDNYIAEIARVLRPAGRCFGTFFLFDNEARSSLQNGGEGPSTFASGARATGPTTSAFPKRLSRTRRPTSSSGSSGTACASVWSAMASGPAAPTAAVGRTSS